MSRPHFPSADEVCPAWRDAHAELQRTQREVSMLPKGTVERRAASRAASMAQRQWDQMMGDLREARRRAGWIPTSPLSWIYRGGGSEPVCIVGVESP